MASAPLSGVWNRSVSTESSGSTEAPPTHDSHLQNVSLHLWYFGPPILLLLGNFGNVMIIILMWRLRSAEGVINILFIALAVTDLVTLDTFLLSEWVRYTFEYNVKTENDLCCKLFNWLHSISTTIGGWLLVGVTAFRAVSVVWPHRVHLICTRRAVVGVVGGVVAVPALLYAHNLYGYNIEYVNNNNNTRSCIMRQGNYREFAEGIFAYVDLVLYSLLPSACIIVANSVLVWTLRATIRTARHMASGDKGSSDRIVARQKVTKSVTVTVILVSLAYIVLTLPVTVFVILYFELLFDITSGLFHLISSVVYLLMFCNSAVNFYLYCLTGVRFRQEFVKVFCSTQLQNVSG